MRTVIKTLASILREIADVPCAERYPARYKVLFIDAPELYFFPNHIFSLPVYSRGGPLRRLVRTEEPKSHAFSFALTFQIIVISVRGVLGVLSQVFCDNTLTRSQRLVVKVTETGK